MSDKKKILIVNGANLNLTGQREQSIYGKQDFDSFLNALRQEFADKCQIDYYQSNIEGEIVNALQAFNGDTVIINAGGYTHTSVVIRDAVSAISIPCIEVHISNIFARETFRHVSLLSPVCKGTITGFGLESYRLAVSAALKQG
ncbi:MAG: 3-dehydroquinate dehydratase [Bacteroidales bacterium]|nr:3-dehydroquinate dehydratase [Bacteroidales bacterium]